MKTLAARLAPHYTAFDVARHLRLTGHSHQAWPDRALGGVIESFVDAARLVDDKWNSALDRADQLRRELRPFIGSGTGSLALGPSTHDLLLRFLSTLDLGRRPRLVTTDGEFHSVRRQLRRLGETGLQLTVVPTRPVPTLAERLLTAVDDRTAAVVVSAVLFETSQLVPELPRLTDACHPRGIEVLVDLYHAVGVLPCPAAGLDSAWLVGGGYKYLQLGEGNCYLRVPPHAAEVRPVITGWFAEFAIRADVDARTPVPYPAGDMRLAGSTYDPASHYRATRVMEFFREQGLTPTVLRAVSRHQVGLLTERFDGFGVAASVATRDRQAQPDEVGGFLAIRTRHAASLVTELAARGVATDCRGEHLRLGPAPYLSDSQLHQAMDILGTLLSELDSRVA